MSTEVGLGGLPIIDVAALGVAGSLRQREVEKLRSACRDTGFFCAKSPFVSVEAIARLEQASRSFFALERDRRRLGARG